MEAKKRSEAFLDGLKAQMEYAGRMRDFRDSIARAVRAGAAGDRRQGLQYAGQAAACPVACPIGGIASRPQWHSVAL